MKQTGTFQKLQLTLKSATPSHTPGLRLLRSHLRGQPGHGHVLPYTPCSPGRPHLSTPLPTRTLATQMETSLPLHGPHTGPGKHFVNK